MRGRLPRRNRKRLGSVPSRVSRDCLASPLMDYALGARGSVTKPVLHDRPNSFQITCGYGILSGTYAPFILQIKENNILVREGMGR